MHRYRQRNPNQERKSFFLSSLSFKMDTQHKEDMTDGTVTPSLKIVKRNCIPQHYGILKEPLRSLTAPQRF